LLTEAQHAAPLQGISDRSRVDASADEHNLARTRTTKKLAQRIDLNYFKRPTALKRAKLWLSVGLPAVALIWIAWHGFARDSRVYSSGRMSEAHAVLEAECAACHVKTAGEFSAKANDDACLSCHDGPMHRAAQKNALGCATCHTEHRGRVNIVAAKNESCAECHGDLQAGGGATRYAAHIKSFENGHPEFAALRANGGAPTSDPGTIRVNHAIHMKPIRRGPNWPNVQLECGDCHQAGATAADWRFSDATYTSSNTSYSPQGEVLAMQTGAFLRPAPMTGRELMAPVRFPFACSGCHSLSFDKRFNEGVPHDQPEVVHAFLVKKFGEYIAAHPAEVRVVRDPGRDLTGKPLAPEFRMLTATQWVTERTAEAEDLLWRKTCKQCHTLANGSGQNHLPAVEPARTTVQWMSHAKFDHDAHRGFSCVNCHEKAMNSTESSDMLLPGIATCKACHAPGPEHAESRCFECHTYHDWAKRKEVKPTFTLPALRTVER
jgi:hypothetical protein